MYKSKHAKNIRAGFPHAVLNLRSVKCFRYANCYPKELDLSKPAQPHSTLPRKCNVSSDWVKLTKGRWRQEQGLEPSPSDGEGRECVAASDLDRLRIRLGYRSLYFSSWPKTKAKPKQMRFSSPLFIIFDFNTWKKEILFPTRKSTSRFFEETPPNRQVTAGEKRTCCARLRCWIWVALLQFISGHLRSIFFNNLKI